MAVKNVTPYIQFNGNAEEAIRHYESTLGAKVEHAVRFADVPEMQCPPEHKNRIMHAVLHIGSGAVMLSDCMPDRPVAAGTNVQIVLDYAVFADMQEAFDALSSAGTVTFPIHDAFWGAKFGMLTDAYGIGWMFNCETKKSGA